MQTVRKCLVVITIIALASPTWSDTVMVGKVVSGRSATLRNAPLESAQKVFSGDTVSCGNEGSAQIEIAGGDRISINHGSAIRITKTQESINLSVERGRAWFNAKPGDALVATIGDATVRPFHGQAVGAIFIESKTSVVVTANEGSLQIVAPQISTPATLNSGQAARVTLAPQPAANSPVNSASNFSNTGLAVAGIAIIAAAGAAAYFLDKAEPTQSQETLSNEMSPFKLGAH